MKGWSLIFYGTTQPVDKNDPVSVPINPPNFNNHLSAQSTPNGLSKTPNGKGNRKQQQLQQQQQKTTNTSSIINVTPSRKNGAKNNQNKNQSGSNKNAKQRMTTARPLTTLYFNKDRKYEFINGIVSVNKPTSSPPSSSIVRPNKVLNNNVESKSEKMVYLKTPIKAPKQVKENQPFTTKMTTSKYTIAPAGASSKTLSSSSLSFLSSATTSLPHIDILDSFQFTSNPNIPKHFQQYEKIQKFYPELQPYENVSKQPTRSPSVSSGGNGKPSRDGSRGNYFSNNNQQQNQQQQQQYQLNSPSISMSSAPSSSSSASRVLSTALLGTAVKKSFPSQSSYSSRQQMKAQSSVAVAAKNGNG